jgi:hypothetical protein
MTKKIYYEKVGRKYIPVAEYDKDFMDSFPKGNHLVMSYPGGSSRRFNIDPNYAAMIAAGRVAEDAISRAVVKASEMRPHKNPITEEQQQAWQNLAEAFGDDRYYIEIPSAREVAEAGVRAMEEQATKLMLHPAVKKAYENFQIVAKLVSESERPGVK